MTFTDMFIFQVCSSHHKHTNTIIGSFQVKTMSLVRVINGRQSHLPELVLFLHLTIVVQVPQPGADVQSPVETFLRVSLRGGKSGSADGELHA